LQKLPPVKLFFPKEDIQEIQEKIKEILESGNLTLGKYTKEFEKEFAKFSGTHFNIATNSGTSALEIILRTLNLKKTDEVLVPTNTFSATASVILHSGYKLRFVDVDRHTACVTEDIIKKAITPKVKAIIVVHIGGLVCPEILEIRDLCENKLIALIEDAAHAHGSEIHGKPAGSLGIAGAFSFYPTKVITSGEGGMITTNDIILYDEALKLRDQGKDSFLTNDITRIGYNWRLPEISAAVGLVQLKRLPEIIRDRNEVAKFYDQELSNLSDLEIRETPKGFVNNYYKYVLYSNKKDELIQKLREKGVSPSGAVYSPPLHLQPIFRKLFGTKEGDFPGAEEVSKRMLCLPIYKMSKKEMKYVTDKVKECI